MKRFGNRKKFYIPRRGRIRLVLGVVSVLLLFWLTKGEDGIYRTFKNLVLPSTEQVALPLKPKEVATGDGYIDSLLNIPGTGLPDSLTNESLAALMKKWPLQNIAPCDTIITGNGLLIRHYSIDTTIQKQALGYFSQYKPRYGGLTVLDPQTGRVLALVSFTNDSSPPLGNDLFCRSIFPAASIIKTVTAAGVIEQRGILPESLILTTGSDYTLYHSQMKQEPVWSKDIPLIKAFARSINPAFGRLGMYVLGSSLLREYAAKFGFNQDIPFDLPVDKSGFSCPDTGFGIAEVACGFNRRTTLSPILGALIASAVSNRGTVMTPTLIDSITSPNRERPLYTRLSKMWREPIKPATADQLKIMMNEVARQGTAHKAFRTINRSERYQILEYGGKTGSVSQDSLGKVDWFIGFSRSEADSGKQLATGIVTTHGPYWTVHSSYIAAELMRRYFQEDTKRQTKKEEYVTARNRDTLNTTPR